MSPAMRLNRRPFRVDRKPGEFSGDQRRMILRRYQPGPPPERTAETIRKVFDLSEEEAYELLQGSGNNMTTGTATWRRRWTVASRRGLLLLCRRAHG
jgi:hypothetical protein